MSIRNGPRDPLSPVAKPFISIGNFWLKLSAPLQVSLIFLLLIAKNGFDVELQNVQEAYLPGSLIFPEPAGYFSASIGQVIFANVFHLTNTPLWILGHSLLSVGAILLASILVIRNFPSNRSHMLLVLAAATSTSAVLLSIGKYDVFTFLGGALLVLARSNWVAIIGAVLLASGNPEQAILATCALLLLSFTGDFRSMRARSTIAFAVSVTVWIAVQVWFASAGLDQGRLSLVRTFLGDSISNVIADPLGVIWSWLGVGWVIVAVAIIVMLPKQRYVALASVIAIPAIASIITADGARVFGAVVFPSFLILGNWLSSKKIQKSTFAVPAVGIFIVLFALLPNGIDRPGWLEGQIRGKVMSVTEQFTQP